MRRVVITGMAGITSLGDSFAAIQTQMQAGNTGIRVMADWQDIEGLQTRLGGPVEDFTKPKHYSRKQVRSMGRVALMATVATERALEQAGLLDEQWRERIQDGRMGVAYGSCSGSSKAVADIAAVFYEKTTAKITATTYVEMMSHTAAVNIALFFGLKGRVIPSSSACTSGSQGIGYAYEAIKYGHQDLMVAGGAEELCPSQSAVFDTLFATSLKNDKPGNTPSPFDANRDGLVIGEGASTLVLEEYQHAIDRGATIYAELIGFATNTDARHITQPTAETMQLVMAKAIEQAEIDPGDIGYICAHGTATEQGDIAESQATAALFADKAAVSSLKSWFGHTLGACGAIESWLSIEMMNNNWFAPTANLEQLDERCGDLDYVRGQARQLETDYVMNNNFAFGGINTALIFKRWS